MIIIKRFRMTKDHYIYLDQIQNKEFSRLPRSALYDCLSSPICFNISEIQRADNECSPDTFLLDKRIPMTVTD